MLRLAIEILNSDGKKYEKVKKKIVESCDGIKLEQVKKKPQRVRWNER